MFSFARADSAAMLETAREVVLEVAREATDDGSRAEVSEQRPTSSVAGNMRLTSAIGLVLLALLPFEAATTIALGALLPIHIALGLLLIAPLALKIATTSWRMLRYYTRNADYVRRGPPALTLRALAPFLVLSTVTLFGSGVALVATGARSGILGTVHVASFVVWIALVLVHILAYAFRATRIGRLDWQRSGRHRLPGALGRRALLVGGLTAGIVLAVTLYPRGNESVGEHGWDDSPVSALQQTLRLP